MDGINEKSQIPLENEPAKTFSDFVCGWCTIRLSRSSLFSVPNRFFSSLFLLKSIQMAIFCVGMSRSIVIVTRSWALFSLFLFFTKIHAFVCTFNGHFNLYLRFISNPTMRVCCRTQLDRRVNVFMTDDSTEAGEWRKKTSEIDPFYLFSSFCWQNGTMQTYNLFKFIFAWIQIEGPYNVLVTVPSWRDEEKKYCVPNEIHSKINYSGRKTALENKLFFPHFKPKLDFIATCIFFSFVYLHGKPLQRSWTEWLFQPFFQMAVFICCICHLQWWMASAAAAAVAAIQRNSHKDYTRWSCKRVAIAPTIIRGNFLLPFSSLTLLYLGSEYLLIHLYPVQSDDKRICLL